MPRLLGPDPDGAKLAKARAFPVAFALGEPR